MTTEPGPPISRRSALAGLGAAGLGIAGGGATLPGGALASAQATRSLEGGVALVTGSSRNLGRATDLELARRGADVIVNARTSRDEAESVVREAEAFGVRAVALMADVSDEDQVNEMVAEAEDRLGPVTVLINNAGYFRDVASFAEMTTEEWRQPMAVNLDGPFFCSRAVVPGMIASGGGRIITVSGENSVNGRTNWAHVCASKMGALGMTRALAVELAPHGILVNHVVPGAWDFEAESIEDLDLDAPGTEDIPMGRRGLPRELAGVYAFLVSDDSSYITGQTIRVNGGRTRS